MIWHYSHYVGSFPSLFIYAFPQSGASVDRLLSTPAAPSCYRFKIVFFLNLTIQKRRIKAIALYFRSNFICHFSRVFGSRGHDDEIISIQTIFHINNSDTYLLDFPSNANFHLEQHFHYVMMHKSHLKCLYVL